MPTTPEHRLRAMAGVIARAWHEESFGPFTGERREEYARMIVASHILADESRQVLARWIEAGRQAGMSWADVGALLGISKQAAQQRFGTRAEADAAAR